MTSGSLPGSSSIGKRRFMASALNRLIIWSSALLLISVIGFAAYYYVDRSDSRDSGFAQRELAAAEQAVRDDPTNITNRIVLADLYFGKQRYEEAVEQYQAAVEINENSPLARVGLGRAQWAVKDYAGASENFNAVIKLSTEEDISGSLVQTAYYYLGKTALEQGAPEEAAEHFSQATALERTDADAWFMLGTAYAEASMLEEAADALGTAVSFVPNFKEAYELLVGIYEEQGLEGEVLYARGMVAYAEGDLDAAAGKLEDAIGASPALAQAHTGLGLVREIQGRDADAIVAYQQALHLNANDFLARGGMARLTGQTSEDDLPANHPDMGVSDGEGGTP